jgi:hypothetical protein
VSSQALVGIKTMTNRIRARFSVKTLMIAWTLLAAGIGGWIAYAEYKMKNLTKLRQQGEIVIIRNETPKLLQSVGINELSPLSSVPTVELYVTPKGPNALIGDSEELIPKATAQKYILDKATKARNNGAKDIQLILVDSFDPEWMEFASENSMSIVGESRERYLKRLKANRESGANINP